MKRKLIVDLIKSHYEGDGNTFFHDTMEVLKEFKDDGDCDELCKYLESIILPHIKLMPKKEPDTSVHEIYPHDSGYYFFIPQEIPAVLDLDVCPKCGNHNIEKNPFVRCKDCGYYLLGEDKNLNSITIENYYAYADKHGHVHTTTDETKAMTYDEIRKRVLKNR